MEVMFVCLCDSFFKFMIGKLTKSCHVVHIVLRTDECKVWLNTSHKLIFSLSIFFNCYAEDLGRNVTSSSDFQPCWSIKGVVYNLMTCTHHQILFG
jgi:hypothetical protein